MLLQSTDILHLLIYYCIVIMQRQRILIVDDEETLRQGVAAYLELEGYSAVCASGAEEASALDLTLFDLLVLDIMMGDISGFDFLKMIRSNPAYASVPVIFLTAKDTDDDMVSGLQLGADDFITKPFSLRNLKARIDAVLRRRSIAKIGVVCDRLSMTCTVDGKVLELPRKEFEILALLTENPGRIFSRDEVLTRVWPEHVVVSDRTVDVHVTRLRGKIAPYGSHIITRTGYGYGWKN